jgi:hypothetical protein
MYVMKKRRAATSHSAGIPDASSIEVKVKLSITP